MVNTIRCGRQRIQCIKSHFGQKLGVTIVVHDSDDIVQSYALNTCKVFCALSSYRFTLFVMKSRVNSMLQNSGDLAGLMYASHSSVCISFVL